MEQHEHTKYTKAALQIMLLRQRLAREEAENTELLDALQLAEEVLQRRCIEILQDKGEKVFLGSDPQQAEKILSACDAIDIDLLKLIIKGYRYFDIAEILHVSESTIKYRLKRIISISGFETRDEVIDVMKVFLS